MTSGAALMAVSLVDPMALGMADANLFFVRAVGAR